MRIGIILANQPLDARPYRWVSKSISALLITPKHGAGGILGGITIPALCVSTSEPCIIRERPCRSAQERASLARQINQVAGKDVYRYLRSATPVPVAVIERWTVIGRPLDLGNLLPPATFINLDLSYPTALRTTSEHPHAALVHECRMAKQRNLSTSAASSAPASA